MTLAATVAILAAILLGHAALCIAAVNRAHSFGLPRWLTRVLGLALLLFAAAAPVALLGWIAAFGMAGTVSGNWSLPQYMVAGYLALCLAAACIVPWLVWARRRVRPPASLRSSRSTSIDMVQRLGGDVAGRGLNRLLLRMPGNECLRLEVVEKALELPRLGAALDGLTIAHVSDLHFTGKIGRAYFEEISRLVNQMQADLIAITGDIVDHRACIDWVPDLLGNLKSRFGVYYVLGNHDLRVDVRRLRQALDGCGLIPLGGRGQAVEINGQRVLLAGCERPWIRPRHTTGEDPFLLAGDYALRILLAHTPDRFGWARRQGFDLVLAGHTHGGQVRLPLVGPILAPSLHGVKYASGTFHVPPTVMHVSRGLSGVELLRWNCPPELVKIQLVRPQAAVKDRESAIGSAAVSCPY